jgi:hypothetical protein
MVHPTAELVQQSFLNRNDVPVGCPVTSPRAQPKSLGLEFGFVFIFTSTQWSNCLSDPIADLEKTVEENPNDARALVALANAYWLSGRGSEPVGDLASRAIAADPANRAGWHLWALSESDPRKRLGRWQQVSERFPADDLARANVADNAAALAGAEHDYDALDLAIVTYEQLRSTATERDQREALDTALRSLRGWKF